MGHASSRQAVQAGWLPCDRLQCLSLAGDTGRSLLFRPWTVLFWILLPSQGEAPCRPKVSQFPWVGRLPSFLSPSLPELGTVGDPRRPGRVDASGRGPISSAPRACGSLDSRQPRRLAETELCTIPSERSDPDRLRARALGSDSQALAPKRRRLPLGGACALEGAGGLWEEGGGGERRGRRGGRSVFTQRRAGADAEPGAAAAARWSWRISWRISG